MSNINTSIGEQIGLFSLLKDEPTGTPTDTKEQQEECIDWCLVYLVTMAGGNKGNLFILKRDDAIKLCSDECSHGIGRGGAWMFQWTSLNHFKKDDDASAQHKNTHGKLEPFRFIPDTGKQDADFERLGIVKPTLMDIDRILNDLGYKLDFRSSFRRRLEEQL